MVSCIITLPSNISERPIEVRPGQILQIGRAPAKEGDSFVIDSPDVSLKHAEIHCSQFAATIVDVGSVFGSWVNEKKLNKGRHCPIRSGDVIKLGEQKLIVVQCPEKDSDGINTQAACRQSLKALTPEEPKREQISDQGSM